MALDYTIIGERLKKARLAKNLTQEQLAEMVGISRQHMGAIEAPNMNRGLSIDLLLNIATVLEIEPYLLLKFPSDP